jgi:hypothetical protein
MRKVVYGYLHSTRKRFCHLPPDVVDIGLSDATGPVGRSTSRQDSRYEQHRIFTIHQSDQYRQKNLTRFLFRMTCNKETLYHHCFGIWHQEGQREPGRTETERETSASGLC